MIPSPKKTPSITQKKEMDEYGEYIAWLLSIGRWTRTIPFFTFLIFRKKYIFYLDYLKMNNLFILGLELGFLAIKVALYSVNINLKSNS